jgi:ribosome-associated protein
VTKTTKKTGGKKAPAAKAQAKKARPTPVKAKKSAGKAGKASAKPKPTPRVNAPTGRASERRPNLPVSVRGGGKPDLGRKAPLPGLGPLLPVEPRPEDPRLKKLAVAAWEAALGKKAIEPVLLDVRALASYADYILVVSGRSDRQVQAIADGVREELRAQGLNPLSSEGTREGQWSLLDFGDVIVHVFYHPVREFYDLEGLWSDAPRVPLEVPPEARAQYADSYAP